jgi:hypothetical protein
MQIRSKSSGHLVELSKTAPLNLTDSFHTAETSAVGGEKNEGGGETNEGGGENGRRCGVLVARSTSPGRLERSSYA